MYEGELSIEAELTNVQLYSDNCLEIVFRLPDGSYFSVQWAPDTPEYDDLLEFLSSHASRRLDALGRQGIVLTSSTDEEDDE